MATQRFPLGRIYAPDERDSLYPFAKALAAPPLTPSLPPMPPFRTWSPGVTLDQGRTSECVAFSWKAWLLASPIRQGAQTIPHDIYTQAQAIDGIQMPHEGSTVRAGAKILTAAGYITEFLWAESLEDIKTWILSRGPVVLGTNWYASMFDITSKGYASLVPSSGIAGGHAYTAIGYSDWRKAYRCVNSWGDTWGEHGKFWLRQADLVRLLAEDGEACTAEEARSGA